MVNTGLRLEAIQGWRRSYCLEDVGRGGRWTGIGDGFGVIDAILRPLFQVLLLKPFYNIHRSDRRCEGGPPGTRQTHPFTKRSRLGGNAEIPGRRWLTQRLFKLQTRWIQLA